MSLRKSLFGTANMLGIAGLLALGACSSDKGGRDVGGDNVRGEVGEVGLGLTLPDGTEVNEVTYRITRNGTEVETGTIAIGPDGRASKLITGLQSGSGYNVVLTADRGDAGPDCQGSADFSVTADTTTNVDVVLSCDDAGADEGSVQFNGTFNICPRITSASFSPATQAVGGTIAITAAATDRETPAAIVFAWTASAGSFSAPGSASTNYTCEAAGEKTLTLTVTDGTGPAACTRSKTYTVTCTGDASVPQQDSGVPGEVDSGAPGEVDSGVPGEVDSGAPGEVDSGAPGEVDSGAPGEVDSGSDSGNPQVDSGPSGPNACDECIATNCSLYQGELNVIELCSDAACQAVLACAEMNDCATSSGDIGDCFCGTDVDPTTCSTVDFVPTGVCKDIIATNLGLSDTPENRRAITERYVNPEYATGRAMQYLSCELDNCAAPCAAHR